MTFVQRRRTDVRGSTPVAWDGHRQVVDLVWHCQDWSVAVAASYKGYRYPIEVIGHAVWLAVGDPSPLEIPQYSY